MQHVAVSVHDSYQAFQSLYATRPMMVYTSTNDGMLHAFVAATGDEAWAVIPQTVLPNMYKLADSVYRNNHQFLVDGSPVVGDVYSETTSTWPPADTPRLATVTAAPV